MLKNINIIFVLTVCSILISSCTDEKSKDSTEKSEERKFLTIGQIERLDVEINQIVADDVSIEVLAYGFEWSEGPVWISEGKFLLFSDIPPNSIYKWSEADSIELFVKPSGYTGEPGRAGEPGSNGLLLDEQGRLVLCQHGDRRVAVMDTPIENPAPEYITLADNYQGKRLNSPNDAVFHSNGDLYFTDPPYGLEKNVDDPAKELPFQGVYKLGTEGDVILLTDELSRPNGIGLSPDEKTLYVANSDPEKAIWMAYDINADGLLENGGVFYDATAKVGQEKGLPDGLKVHSSGIIFATGPGGVLIFNPDGRHLGTIKTTEATANCAFDDSESYLYITADMYLLRVRLKQG